LNGRVGQVSVEFKSPLYQEDVLIGKGIKGTYRIQEELG
jgi:hypothetical protein